MSTSGMDDLARQLFEMGEHRRNCRKMVVAGAKKMVSQWKYEIQKYDHIEDGDLINSITHGKPKAKDNALTVEIYANGKLNGTKAFMTLRNIAQGGHALGLMRQRKKQRTNAREPCKEVFDEEMRKRGFN